ncbi:VanZ family protein [Marinobacter salicampi]|uniref:VanZ family protein n=1 Tax=Marinobacter salicampi TaxID=435907 RepID=UPI001F5E3D7B|nr:VanZ family protein [Marinobacter salicampi]
MSLKNQIARLLGARTLWRVFFAASVLAIVYLATTSQTYTVQATFSDKFNHIIAFTELTILVRLGWPRAHWLTAILLVMGLGLLIELVQAPLAHRHFSFMDLLADATGMAVGLLVSPWLKVLARRWAADKADQR